MRNAALKILSVAAALTLIGQGAARACSVCYGDPSDPMVQGAQAGVLFLGIFIYVQLMLMGGVGIYWYIRARRLADDAPSTEPPRP